MLSLAIVAVAAVIIGVDTTGAAQNPVAMNEQAAAAAVKAVLLGEACLTWLIILLWPSMNDFGHGRKPRAPKTKPEARPPQESGEGIRQDEAI